MIKMTKLNSLFFLLLTFSLMQVFQACNQVEENLSERDVETAQALSKSGAYPLYLALDNERDKRLVDDYFEADYKGYPISAAKIGLNNSDFAIFKSNYGLGEYDRIIEIVALVDAPRGYLNHTIVDAQVARKLVYYLDAKDGVRLDIMEGNQVLNSYDKISAIYESVNTSLLFNDIEERVNPMDLRISPSDTEYQARWARHSEDRVKNEITDVDEIGIGSGDDDCKYQCSGDGVDCSNLNPAVCGSICQLRTTEGNLRIDRETEGMAKDFKGQFPQYYELRSTLREYQGGLDLIHGLYDIGQLTFTKQVELSLSVQVQAVSLILKNKDKLSAFMADASSGDILYTAQEAKEYKALIDAMKAQSNHAGYQSVLKDFETQLDAFKDTSIRDIYAKLKQ